MSVLHLPTEEAQKDSILLIGDNEDSNNIVKDTIKIILKNKDVHSTNKLEIAKELHNKYSPAYILFNIQDFNKFGKIIEYFSRIKTVEKYLSISEEDGNVTLKLIQNRMDDFLFHPIDINKLTRKILKYEYLDTGKLLASISLLEETKLKEFGYEFYKTNHEVILKHSDLLKSYFKNFAIKEKSKIKSLYEQYGYGYYSDIEKFSLSLQEFLEGFFVLDIEQRRENARKFIMLLLNDFRISRGEILLGLFYDIILLKIQHSHKKEDWTYFFIENAKILCSIDIRFMALTMKYELQERIQRTNRTLHESVIYILMNNTSTKLQNHLTKISTNCDKIKNLKNAINEHNNTCCPKAKKRIETIHSYLLTTDGQPIQNIQNFLFNIVKLFRNYKDKVNYELESHEIEFLFDFMGQGFLNAEKTARVQVINNLQDDIKYNINENVVIAALYALYQNAREAGATKITVELSCEDYCFFVSVANNGIQIEEEIVYDIFNKHFCSKSKRDKGHHGLGLSIAKDMIESLDGELTYCENKKVFIIKLPQLSI